jgi:AraC-like DNA-binding protein
MDAFRPLSVRRYDDGIDRWEMASAAAAPGLAGRVDGYCAYAEHTASFTARRELAAAAGVLIFVLGAPLSITGADGANIILRSGEAFAGGIAGATSISRALGPQRGLHVYMPLASLATLCQAPAAEIANRCVSLSDMVGARARRLGQQLGDANSPEAQFTLLDSFFGSCLAEASVPDRPVHWAMSRLRRANAPGIGALADEIGWSRKHFACRFAAVTGFSPGHFRRLARFERLCASLASQPGESLAGLAADAGYYDQPHLSREVAAFSAMTPAALRARLLPAQGGFRHE